MRLGIWELITVGRSTRLGYSGQGLVSGINEPNVCPMHGVAAVSIHLLNASHFTGSSVSIVVGGEQGRKSRTHLQPKWSRVPEPSLTGQREVAGYQKKKRKNPQRPR